MLFIKLPFSILLFYLASAELMDKTIIENKPFLAIFIILPWSMLLFSILPFSIVSFGIVPFGIVSFGIVPFAGTPVGFKTRGCKNFLIK